MGWNQDVFIRCFFELGNSSQVQRTHQKPGKKSSPEYGEQSHPYACPKRETMTVEQPV